MVIRDIETQLEKSFREANIENSRQEAYMLLEYVLKKDKSRLICHCEEKVNEIETKELLKLSQQRISGKPIQYIIGKTYFFGNEFYVDENVLIPRADTEILVEEVIKFGRNFEKIKILDLCTGSGCIAISLKKELGDAELYASDISEKAIKISEHNADRNGVKINFAVSNLFDNISEKNFDVIVSNPPYIEDDEINNLSEEVKQEPIIALDGGKDGLKFYREISKKAKEHLIRSGKLFLEIGYKQYDDVESILTQQGYTNIEKVKDYGENNRVVIAQLK